MSFGSSEFGHWGSLETGRRIRVGVLESELQVLGLLDLGPRNV